MNIAGVMPTGHLQLQLQAVMVPSLKQLPLQLPHQLQHQLQRQRQRLQQQ